MFSGFVELIREIYGDTDSVQLHGPVFCGHEKKYLEQCIDSTYVSSVGSFVSKFENDISSFTGIPHAVACVNGTSALHIALILCGVEDGDEVLTQALTFVATANAIKYCRAFPIFIDSDRERLGMSPQSLSDYLEEFGDLRDDGYCYNKKTGRKIKACVPMHVFGHPVDVSVIKAICDKFNISLLEDAAESLGSYYKGSHTGVESLVSVLSFNGNKTITTGGGGMILTSNPDLALRAKHLTTTAKIPHAWEFFHDEIGYNYRMPNLNAALGVAQLEYIDKILVSKRKIALAYQNYFNSTCVRFVSEPSDSKSNYWLNSIIFESRSDRDEFLRKTNEMKIMTRPIWNLMSELPHFAHEQKSDLSNACWISDRLVNLPSGAVINGIY